MSSRSLSASSFKPHQNHGVERVDRRHQQRRAAGLPSGRPFCDPWSGRTSRDSSSSAAAVRRVPRRIAYTRPRRAENPGEHVRPSRPSAARSISSLHRLARILSRESSARTPAEKAEGRSTKELHIAEMLFSLSSRAGFERARLQPCRKYDLFNCHPDRRRLVFRRRSGGIRGSSRPARGFRCRQTADPSTTARKKSAPRSG